MSWKAKSDDTKKITISKYIKTETPLRYRQLHKEPTEKSSRRHPPLAGPSISRPPRSTLDGPPAGERQGKTSTLDEGPPRGGRPEEPTIVLGFGAGVGWFAFVQRWLWGLGLLWVIYTSRGWFRLGAWVWCGLAWVLVLVLVLVLVFDFDLVRVSLVFTFGSGSRF